MRFLIILFFLLWTGISTAQSLVDRTPTSDVISGNNFNTSRGIVTDVDIKTDKTVYAWLELDVSGTTKDVYCAIYDKKHLLLVNAFRVNNVTTDDQMTLSIKIHQEDNSFVIAWASKQNGTDYNLYMKKISLDVNNLNSSSVSTQSDVAVITTSFDQYWPKLVIDYTRNELLVGYSGYESPTTRDTYVRQFDYATLAPIASAFSLNPTPSGDQFLNCLDISVVTGELIATYQQTPATSGLDAFKRVFTYSSGVYAGGTASMLNNYTSNDQFNANIAINQQNGKYTISWTSVLQDGSGWGVYAKIFDKSHTLLKDEFLVSSSATDNQLNIKPVWDEQTGSIFYFFHHSGGSFSTLRYRILDNNFNFVGNNMSALWNGTAEINTQNFWLGYQSLVYNQFSRILTLGYDLFDNFGGNTKGCMRVFEYLHPNLQPSSTCSTDLNMLWKEEINYDEYGNIISNQRMYYNSLGVPIQQQVRNITENKIIASAVVYDVQGRPALQTLPAAITQTCFTYNTNFIATDFNCGSGNNCNVYDYTSFTTGLINTAGPVGNSTAALGNFYSNNNTGEPYVPTTGYPYSLIDFNDRIPGGQIRASAPGETLRMGQGHESKAVVLPLLDELDAHYLAIRNSYYVSGGPASLAWQGTKTISTDQNGKETISFQDKGGNVLATAIGNGSTMTTVNANLGPQVNYLNITVPSGAILMDLKIRGTSMVDLYNFNTSASYSGPADLQTFQAFGGETIQIRSDQSFTATWGIYVIAFSYTEYEGTSNSLDSKSTLDLYVKSGLNISYNAGVLFKIYDLAGGDLVTSVTNTYTNAPGSIAIPAGLYRIRVEGITTPRTTYTASDLTISYQYNYSEFSYVFYDNAGMPIREISPKGVDLTTTAEPLKFYSKYTYDTEGKVLSSYDSDRGLAEYVYQKDGQLRFSQDARQKALNKFSYLNYNLNGELTEQGEYGTTNGSDNVFQNTIDIYNNVTPSSGISVGSIIESTDGLNDARCAFVNMITMHKPDATGLNAVISGYSQRYINGRVSKAYNGNNTSWYSYNEEGRLEWMVQNIAGLGVKTIHYEYGILGNVKKTIYQKGTSAEKLIHQYEVDMNMRLSKVKTRYANNLLQQEALYKYYLHGPLKRTELAVDLQGIDYTYTITGQLKSINHPTLSNTNDPGKDSYTGTNSSFAPDVFGMQLQYFDGDYNRSGSNITSTSLSVSDQFNGMVKGIKWQTKGHDMSGNMPMYAYSYDQKNQLLNADFGTVAPASEGTFNNSTAYDITNTYDVQGNLLSKLRNDGAGSAYNNLTYTYGSTPVNNQLNTITASSVPRGYTHDQIGRRTTETRNGLTYQTIAYDPYDMVVDGKQYDASGVLSGSVHFTYNERGQRQKKEIYVGTTLSMTTYYVLDVQGNILSIYDDNNTSHTISQSELPIYGKGRIGEVRKNGTAAPAYVYELKDHTGSVRATINRVKASGQAVIETWSDYYADGQIMPTRSGSSSLTCRFGYQGEFSENDQIGYNAFDLRMFETETGRWISPDPYAQYHSPYMAMANNPVSFIDPDGGYDVMMNGFSLGYGGPTGGPIGGTGAQPTQIYSGINASTAGPGTNMNSYNRVAGSSSDRSGGGGGYYYSPSNSGMGGNWDAMKEAYDKYQKDLKAFNAMAQVARAAIMKANVGDGTVYNSSGTQYRTGNVGVNIDEIGNQNGNRDWGFDNFSAFDNENDFSINEPLDIFEVAGKGKRGLGRDMSLLKWISQNTLGRLFQNISNRFVRIGKLFGSGKHPLRAAYEAEVKQLSSIATKMKAEGKSSEEIARTLHGLRRELGVKYKNVTPKKLLEHIYDRNLKKYGDKLGPSIDYLRNEKNMSWDEIIESATRPGGKDLNFNKP